SGPPQSEIDVVAYLGDQLLRLVHSKDSVALDVVLDAVDPEPVGTFREYQVADGEALVDDPFHALARGQDRREELFDRGAADQRFVRHVAEYGIGREARRDRCRIARLDSAEEPRDRVVGVLDLEPSPVRPATVAA